MTSAAPHAERAAYTWGPGSGFERLVAALEAHGCGMLRKGMVRCPAHEDHRPSLSVKQGERGAVIHCFAGCKMEDVLRALELDPLTIFDQAPEKTTGKRANGAARPERLAEYVYTDRMGEPLTRKVRLEPGFDGGGKSFVWEVPDGSGWRKAERGKGEGNPRVLYNLPLVVEADHIHLCEGEKAADALTRRGLIATCAPTTGWDEAFTAALRGKRVTLWVDRDAEGEKQARAAFDSLHTAGVAVELVCSRVLTEHADAFDHLAAGHAPDQGEPFAFTRQDEPAPDADDSHALAFTGRRLLALLERPPLAPLEPGIPPPNHLTLLVAPAFTGKTSLCAWLAMARAGGVAPWAGATPFEPGRSLFVSLDEAAEQVARRMRSLQLFHPAGRLDALADRIVVLGPDRELAPGALDVLRLDSRGLETLEHLIARAADEGRPFREVYLDSYADFLPLGESENSNEEATRIGGALEGIAIRTGAALVLLHHTGKPSKDAKDDAPPDLRFIGRGASALAAKARAVVALEAVGQPHLRRLRTATNLTRAPGPAHFQVASEQGAESDLLFFRPFDPLAAFDPFELLSPDEDPISTSALAWRLAGKEPVAGKEPPGEMKVLAAQVRDGWQARKLIEVTPGKRGAKLIRLKGGRSA